MQVKNLLLIIYLGLFAGTVLGQTTEFTYQGSLKNGAVEANGNYDFEFLLYSSQSGGAQIGSTIPRTSVAVVDGIFSVKLDFGTVFTGADRYLEIRVKAAGAGGFTILDPRQRVGSSPYAIRSLAAETAVNASTADTATDASQLGGIAASQYVQTADPRLTDARPPVAGSANYIQNTASPQTASNFNVSGNGTAAGTLSGNVVNAATQYNISGQRVLRAFSSNTFIGLDAGLFNNGTYNSFFGLSSGSVTGTGVSNSFFGSDTGKFTTSGGNNTFMGDQAGVSNSIGNNNTFYGRIAGGANTTGSNNTVIGSFANLSASNLVYATAIGSDAIVTTNNRIQLGRAGVDTVRIGGLITGSSAIHVCLADFVLSTCSSSRRYKEDIQPLAGGLNAVRQFRPVNFKWRDRDERDIGLIAEEVAEIEPLLVTHNQDGQIEGVKYELLNVLLINAVKEQQSQIGIQQKQIDQQNDEIRQQRAALNALRALVCLQNPNTVACKPTD